MPKSLRVIDPHIHLWDLSTGLYPGLETPSADFGGDNTPIARSYLLDEFLAESGDAVEILGAVHVEAFPTDPVAETRALQAVADQSPVPIVVVGHADLSSPDIDAVLEGHRAQPAFRGIRQVLNRHADPLYNYVGRDFMDDPVWRRGFARLGALGLSFDLQLYPGQMRQAADLAAEHPETAIILNHAGMWADRHLAGWREWRDGLRMLAARDNLSVKISGLGMLDHRWSVESIRPLVLEVLDAFGTERAMFASNFPVDKLYGDYPTLWAAFDAIVADLSETERAALFRDNAARIYRIPAR
ncbi:amidohydrolase family protein [Amaricoccus sp. W119]|uniref:amidohydrolase family protein n=1 Tax=Amaricoccus sp. W119 TaxID=3391833 RepID=UPI0039A57AB6